MRVAAKRHRGVMVARAVPSCEGCAAVWCEIGEGSTVVWCETDEGGTVVWCETGEGGTVV